MGERLLVCGGRNYSDATQLGSILTAIRAKRGVEVVIHGAARGADTLAAAWAFSYFVPQVPFPANWDKHGKAAGAIRNQQMIDEGRPTLGVAFPGGKGTADMVGRLKAAGIECIEVKP